jgi:PAS domain S-box-containing protein
MMAPPVTRLSVRAGALGLVVIFITIVAWLRMRGIEVPSASAGLIAVVALASALGGLRVGLMGGVLIAAWILLARSVPDSPLYYLPADRLTVLIELAALAVAMLAGAVTHRRAAWLRREWWNATDRADAATSRIRALRAVTDPGLATLSFDELLTELLSRIRKHLGADYATVLQLSSDGSTLKTRASDGLEEEVTKQVEVPVGETLSGYVALSREVASFDDLAESGVLPSALRDRFASVAAAPLLVEDSVLGVLEIGTRGSRHFTEDDLRLLQLVADRVATAIAQARLLDAERGARSAVRESELRTRAVIDSAIDCVISFDSSGRITEWNPAAVRAFGWSPAQAVEQEMAALILPPPTRAVFRAALREHLETGADRFLGRRLELRGLRSDGTEFPVELTITRVPVEGPATFTGYWRDISDRKRAEELQRFLIEASRVLASTLDGNQALSELTRIVVPTLADWCLVDVIDEAAPGRLKRVAVAHVDHAKVERVRRSTLRNPISLEARSGPGRVARTGQAELVPLVSSEEVKRDMADEAHRRAIEETRAVSYVSVPIEARGNVLGVLTLVSSESRRRYGDAELALAQEVARRAAMAVDNARLYEAALVASRAKSDFLAVMSHELRTPLNAITGYAELLLMGIPTAIPPQAHGHVQRIRTASRHLLDIVEEILTFSRVEAGREGVVRGPVDAVALVRDTVVLVEPMAREKGLDFVMNVPTHAVAMETDAGKVRQILLNLLSNAVKFTEQGHVDITLSERDGTVAFIVEDTGIGISPENAERIFEPFWQVQQSATRQAGGTGLGLSVARRLSRLLGGDITLETKPGIGSRFTVTLPLRAPAMDVVRPPRSEGWPARERRRAS